MKHIKRFVDDHLSPRKHELRRQLHLAFTPTRNHQPRSPAKALPRRDRYQMTSFKGPACSDIEGLLKTVYSTPAAHLPSFLGASKSALATVCHPDVLHIWETDSDLDNLLQLSSVVAKVCNLGVRDNKDIQAKSKEGSLIILAEEKVARHNYSRISKLVQHLTGKEGRKYLDDTVRVHGKIFVIRGWNYKHSPSGTGNKEAAEKVMKRINTVIERVIRVGGFSGDNKKIVWHHGPVIDFLLYWIDASPLRSLLTAITITGALDLTKDVRPSKAGRNSLASMELLESYAKRLRIPVVFLDSASQLITSEYLNSYMFFFSYYINTFLSSNVSKQHRYKAQDELVTFVFRLWGASNHTYNNDVVAAVKQSLDGNLARAWAKTCILDATFEKHNCRGARHDAAIHHAVQLADSPFALFHQGDGLAGFARLSVGPAAMLAKSYHFAAPVQIDFKGKRLRPSTAATFHILIPAKGQDAPKIENRTQGLMMAVLECVRQEKGNPEVGGLEKDEWKDLVKACLWALNRCKGKMPKDVADKVKFLRNKLEGGLWSFVLGVVPKDNMKGAVNTPAAAVANPISQAAAVQEPMRTYGFGQGPGAGQTMGVFGHQGMAPQGAQVQGMPQQPMVPQQPVVPQQQNMQTQPMFYPQQTQVQNQQQAPMGNYPMMYGQPQGQAYPYTTTNMQNAVPAPPPPPAFGSLQ